MTDFKIHDLSSAPDNSTTLLKNSLSTFGMIPNLHGVLSESPAALEAYQVLHKLFTESTTFNNDELTVIWQTINVENNCHYCVPAHTAIAQMMKVDNEITNSLRNKTKLPTKKLQALHDMTLSIVRNKGQVENSICSAFFEAGYENKHILEILLGLSQKILSNYTNHFANTPVDEPFKKFI